MKWKLLKNKNVEKKFAFSIVLENIEFWWNSHKNTTKTFLNDKFIFVHDFLKKKKKENSSSL